MAQNLPGKLGGTDLLQDAFNVARRGALLTILGLSLGDVIDVATGEKLPNLDVVPHWLTDEIFRIVGESERIVGAPLFDFLVAASSGVELSSSEGRQEADAVRMVERMLGFAVALPFAVEKLEAGLTALLGEHAPKGLIESISKVPEELGINFFIGTVLERIFETAVSRPLEEAIAEQKRPARMEWPQIRSLARQKAISQDELVTRLRHAGWRDLDIPLLLNLDRQLLSVGDLQAAYMFGLRDEAFIEDYLNKLGFNDEDRALVTDIYLKRAETAGGDQLRAVAQRGYLDGNLSESEYRGLLTQAHVPPASMDLEVEAANLVRAWGKKTLSTAEVKKLLDDGRVDDNQAHQRLVLQGYTDEDASLLIQDWHAQKELGHPGLTENRVLAYLRGGVLTAAEAYDHLVANGMNARDARFLVEHPEASAQTSRHKLSQATILAALKDGVIDQPTAMADLLGIGVDPDEATLAVQVANIAVRRGPKPRQGTKVLSEATVLEALKLGMAEPTWAVRELVTIGYTEADAMLITEVERIKLDPNLLADWTVLT